MKPAGKVFTQGLSRPPGPIAAMDECVHCTRCQVLFIVDYQLTDGAPLFNECLVLMALKAVCSRERVVGLARLISRSNSGVDSTDFTLKLGRGFD